jgi:hypothetical protein
MKLQKTLLILSASASVIAPDVALARPFPGPPPGGPPPGPIGGLLPAPLADLLPAWPAAVLLVSLIRVVLRALAFPDLPAPEAPWVSLVPADLLVPGPLAFLVLPAP